MNGVLQFSRSLHANQIDAALQFWSENGGWESKEILQLKKAFPSCHEAIRIKAVSVNLLYGTNVIAILKVADCVQRVLERKRTAGPELVEELVKEIKGVTKRKNHSFAAKYAHFFIDSELPILDWYAEWMAVQHLGPSKSSKPERYLRFAEGVETLKRLSGLTCTCAELDQYLWVAGEFWCWKANPRLNISQELKPHFERLLTDPEKEQTLARLLGVNNDGAS
jgi:hypothetical protein